MNITNGTLAAARAYLKAGLSIVPVARDGSKSPDFSRLPRVPGEEGRFHPTWDPFKVELPNNDQIESRFQGSNPAGIGIICGEVSAGLETLDFDAEAETIFPVWCELVEVETPGLIARLSIAKTPKPGYHVRYRCGDLVPFPGNLKLAMDPRLPTPRKEP